MSIRASALVFLAIGGACIVAGGLVAAVTGPFALVKGSWLAAYLVLVAGVAQIGLGVLQERLADRTPSRLLLTLEAGTWNLGNAAVIVGTLVSAPVIVDVGGALLVIALALFLAAVRRSGSAPRRTLWLFRGLVLVLLVSIPVGLVLAAVRAG